MLILDEPTAGLDPEQVAEMRRLIRHLRGERTVILSTHILSEVEATCDRVIIINHGRILAVDTPRNLNQRLRHTSQIHLEVRAAADAVASRLRAIPGVLDGRRGTGCRRRRRRVHRHHREGPRPARRAGGGDHRRAVAAAGAASGRLVPRGHLPQPGCRTRARRRGHPR